MNIGFNSSMNSPKFGMAVKVDESALKTMKRQLVKMSPDKKDAFFEGFNNIKERQESNPVNIIIRKLKHRNALAADIVDSNADTNIKMPTRKQGFFFKNGSLNFLKKAEEDANKLNNINENIAKMPIADDLDKCPGRVPII